MIRAMVNACTKSKDKFNCAGLKNSEKDNTYYYIRDNGYKRTKHRSTKHPATMTLDTLGMKKRAYLG